VSETKVHWLPWSKEAFERAKTLDKPILLDISAVWCHWCHVMDQTTYSDPEVAKLVEEQTVPIRVDNDQRPDINKRYNMGGWPTTAFLTPDGAVITGGTYIPPQQMKQLLQSISQYYKESKQKIKVELKQTEMQELMSQPSTLVLDQEFYQSVIDNVLLEVTSNFDRVYGGFGASPKFPHTDALAFALLEHLIQGHRGLLNVVTKTLQKMSAGGVYDQVEGGFFRYSTTMDWSIPHYEKMCEDNAKLLINYLETYQVTGNVGFRHTAQDIINYVETCLADREHGGFYGSQDADEEYYQMSLTERRKRTPPKVDKTLYTNWNALMASAYLQASVTLENIAYQNSALQTIDLLLHKGFSTKKGMYHYYSAGQGHVLGLLTDQAQTLKCLVDAYQTTANKEYLKHAEGIAQFMLTNLSNKAGGFYDRPETAETLGTLQQPVISLDENCLAVDAFLRLGYLTGSEKYLEAAKKTLNFFSSTIQSYGIMAAGYGLAVELFLRPLQIHIVGSKGDSLTKQLQRESLKAYNPLKTIEVIDPIIDTTRLASFKYPTAETPRAYVCYQGTCTLSENARELAVAITPKR